MGLIPFWATDISGYCGDIKDYPAMMELYLRWMQFGLFNPLSRAHHEGNNAVEPWMFGNEVERICKKAVELKYKLFPYLYTYAREAYDKGLPLMRSLFLEYPNDENALNENGEFLFGKELLVAPVVKKAAVTKQVYLPEGEWIDFDNGKKMYEGEQTITCDAPMNKLPLFVKRGSIIPTMPVMQYIHEKKNYSIRFEIYPAKENQQASFELYEDDGETLAYQKNIFLKTKIICYSKPNGYVIHTNKLSKGYQVIGKRNFVMRLHITSRPKTVLLNTKKIKLLLQTQLEMVERKPSDTGIWSWDEKSGICTILLPDSGSTNAIEILE